MLLIEQFAHVALGLAQTAYVIEGGRIRYEGTGAASSRTSPSSSTRRISSATPRALDAAPHRRLDR